MGNEDSKGTLLETIHVISNSRPIDSHVVKIYSGFRGSCPKCGGDLEYDCDLGWEIIEDQIAYDVECKNKECGFSGREVFNVEFSHFDETVIPE